MNGGEYGAGRQAGRLLRSSGRNREQRKKEWGFVSERRDRHDVLMMKVEGLDRNQRGCFFFFFFFFFFCRPLSLSFHHANFLPVRRMRRKVLRYQDRVSCFFFSVCVASHSAGSEMDFKILKATLGVSSFPLVKNQTS